MTRMRFDDLTVHVTTLDDTGLYIAQCDERPDLTGAGRTADDAVADLRRVYLEAVGTNSRGTDAES